MIFIFKRWFDNNQASPSSYLKYFLKRSGIKIGFCSYISIEESFIKPYIYGYNKLDSTIRLRVNDIIFSFLNSRRINPSFYNPLKNYNILIFEKIFSKKAFAIASKYKKKHTKIILDLDVNYFDYKNKYIKKSQYQNLMDFIQITDLIITTTDYIKNYIIDNKFFENVEVIPEIISDYFFNVKKHHNDKKRINFLYVGYAIKANQLLLIKEVLEKISNSYNTNLILICEKPPLLPIKIKQQFIEFNMNTLHIDMLNGDIFLAPRDLKNSYNLGHAFIKIGYPMSIGIPIVASPIPSYLNSPAIICKDKISWFESIEKLINDYKLRNDIGEIGVKYCKEHYSKEKILEKYKNIFFKVFYNYKN